MFTGIVQACGRVASIQPQPFGVRLVVAAAGLPSDPPPVLGDSVCVGGVCLTVVGRDSERLSFDVVGETLAKTTLGSIKPEHRVNLELAVTPRTPMGGHFVQGHVDGLGRVTQLSQNGDQWRMTIDIEPADPASDTGGLIEAIVPKGAVTVDGVSLTIAAVTGSGFEVALIPTTLQHTTLGEARQGQRVNIESDIVSKTVVHWLAQRFGTNNSGLTQDKLRAAGFLDTPSTAPGG